MNGNPTDELAYLLWRTHKGLPNTPQNAARFQTAGTRDHWQQVAQDFFDEIILPSQEGADRGR